MNTSSFELLPEPELRVQNVCVGGRRRRREATCVQGYICWLCVPNYVFIGANECTCVDTSARMCASVCVRVCVCVCVCVWGVTFLFTCVYVCK